MSCLIERLASGGGTAVLRVCGRIRAQHVNVIKELIERERGEVALDLTEVTLIDRNAVTVLAITERKGVELRNCPAFLREWISSEQQRMAGETPHRASDAIPNVEDL